MKLRVSRGSRKASRASSPLVLLLFVGGAVGTVGALGACLPEKPPVVPQAAEPTAVVAPAPVEPPPPPPPVAKTLFERLGGKEGIAAVVDEFFKNIAADTRVNKLFVKTKGDRLEKLKVSLAEHLCEASGGPCTYAGKDMRAAHKGMGISEGQWDAFIEDLSLALQAKSIGEDEKSELFAAIGKHRDDIVEKKGAKK